MLRKCKRNYIFLSQCNKLGFIYAGKRKEMEIVFYLNAYVCFTSIFFLGYTIAII